MRYRPVSGTAVDTSAGGSVTLHDGPGAPSRAVAASARHTPPVYAYTHPMTTRRPPGSPLAVASDLVPCSASPDHEVRVITDGITCYAYAVSPLLYAVDCDAADRTRTAVEMCCPYRNQPDADPCPGVVSLDLAEESSWTSDEETLHALTAHGIAVVR